METTLTCRALLDFVADYLDGELAAPVRADFEAHLRVCPECVHYLETYRETLRLEHDARDEDGPEVPDALVRAILASQRVR
jgi:anti-sigma factor RsiW